MIFYPPPDKVHAKVKSLCVTANRSQKPNRSGGSVVRAFAHERGGREFNPRPYHTKDVIKMVPDAYLLSAQHK